MDVTIQIFEVELELFDIIFFFFFFHCFCTVPSLLTKRFEMLPKAIMIILRGAGWLAGKAVESVLIYFQDSICFTPYDCTVLNLRILPMILVQRRTNNHHSDTY